MRTFLLSVSVPIGTRHLWAGEGAEAMAYNMCCLDESLPEHVLFALQHLGCVVSQCIVIHLFITFTPFKVLAAAPPVCLVLVAAGLFAGCWMAQEHTSRQAQARHLIREFGYSTAGALFQVHNMGCSKQFRFSMDALIMTLTCDQVSLSRVQNTTGLGVSILSALLVFSIAALLVLHRDLLFQDGSVLVGVHLLAAGVQLFIYMQFFVLGLLHSMELAQLHVMPMYRWLNSMQSARAADQISRQDRLADIPMGILRINQVTVEHNGTAILRSLDLHLNMREYVAVVGDAGAGKSTIAMCILRAMFPVSGHIEIGGVDIENMHQAALRKYVGLVPCRPILFKGSMLANLDPAGTLQQSEVLPLLIAVGLVDKGVRTMPEAMTVGIEDTDRIGSTVKQLICLCRVLLRKPQLLILDEFGANIDGRRIRQIDRFLRTQDHFSVLQLSRNFQHVQVPCVDMRILSKGEFYKNSTCALILMHEPTCAEIVAALCTRHSVTGRPGGGAR